MSYANVIPRKKVKCPRLQLRWAQERGNPNWLCFYELVIPLSAGDIRRDGRKLKRGQKADELVIPMDSGSTSRSGTGTPCKTWPDGKTYYYDSPYRDGAHSKWDSEALGDLPVYVIAPDGTFLEEAVDLA